MIEELQSRLQELEKQNESLRKEKEHYQQVVANLVEGFVMVDAKGFLSGVNDSICRMTGFSEDELIGSERPFPYWPPEEYEKIQDAFQKNLNHEQSNFELIFMRKNGERFPANVTTAVLTDNKGEVTHFFGTIKDISSLKEAELVLKKSEEKYRTLFENTSDGIYKTTPEGKFITVNPALVKMLGYETEDELLGVDIKEKLFFSEKERKKKSFTSMETYRLRKKNGEEIWVEDQARFSIDEHNKVLFNEGIIRDISHRKRAEIELRNNNELLQSILDSPKGIIIFSLDPSYRYKAFTVSHKETMKAIWGVEIEIGMNMLDLISDHNDRKKAKVNFDRTLMGEELIFIEEYGDEELLRSFWENRCSPIYTENGQIAGLTVYVVDVSVRMRDAGNIKQSEKALHEAQKISKIGSWKFNVSTGRLNWTKELYRIFELEGTPDELLYQEFRSKVHEEGLSVLDKNLESVVVEKKSYTFEHRIYKKDGGIKYVFCKGEPVLNDQGEVIEVVGVTQDITEKKLQENIIEQNMEMLNNKNEELKLLIESNLQLENFAYIASHDLKSPVRTISSFAGLLKQRAGGKLNEEENRFLDFIVKGAIEVQGLIEDLLSYSKIKSKGFNPADLDIKLLLNDLLTTMSTDVSEHNASIRMEEIPSRIMGDRTKMWQLFQNLITNAMKFQEKGQYPEVVISCEEGETEWLFAINDNGIGIHEEFHDKIFVLFQQLNTKDQYEGTGLGLAICKKIVDQHKGRLWVESEVGKGSTFYFTLPKAL